MRYSPKSQDNKGSSHVQVLSSWASNMKASGFALEEEAFHLRASFESLPWVCFLEEQIRSFGFCDRSFFFFGFLWRANCAAPGMGKLINNIMTAVFFELSGVLPTEQALSLLKDAVKKTYKNKGEARETGKPVARCWGSAM